MPAQAPAFCSRCGYRSAEALNFCPSCGSDLRGLSAYNDTLAGSLLGKVIADRYRILEKIGEGGMGSVYKVEHTRMGKAMALKLMRGDFSRDKLTVDRFVSEARIVSRLSHIHTISVFDFGETDDGSMYIAMEYCPGRDLSWTLRTEGRLPERRAVNILTQVLRSLAEAHDAGVIHRDIKPGNVMLLRSREGDDFVKVLDFGIAKLAEARGGDSSRSVTGMNEFLGTPNYMPPEQARGLELTPAADLYATGAMLFELVTGRIPFMASTPMGIITAHVTEPPPSPREVAPDASISPQLESVILRALEKDPGQRYQTADEMRVALEGIFTSAGRPLLLEPDMAGMTGELQIASREDWSEFESELRREVLGRRLVPLVALVVLVAVGVLGWMNRGALLAPVQRGVAVDATELEPNNEAAQANLIDPGKDVSGKMTGRFGGGGDVDTFQVDIPPGDEVADVQVTGIPDINLELGLFDAGGRALARIDQVGPGETEKITRVRVSGKLFLQVKENVIGGGTPKENTIDAYRVRVDLRQREPDFEVEPNAEPEMALALRPGSPIRGLAGAPSSRDAFRVVVPEGAELAGVAISGVRGVDLGFVLQAAADRPDTPVNERGEGLPEIAALGAGEQLVFVDTLAGVDHDHPYRIDFFTTPEELESFIGDVEKAGDPLSAAALARAAAARFPRSAAAPRMLWLAAQVAQRAAAKISEEAAQAVGFEPDPRRRRDAVLAFAPLAAWKEASVPLRYVGALGVTYDGEALRKLVASYPQSPLAEPAQSALITGDYERCGAASVAERAAAFLSRYPKSDRAPAALLALARASEDLAAVGKKDRATVALATYQKLEKQFVDSPEAKAATERLQAGGTPPPGGSFYPCE